MMCTHTLTLVTRAASRAAAKFEGHAGSIPAVDRAVMGGVARIPEFENMKTDDVYMSGEH